MPLIAVACDWVVSRGIEIKRNRSPVRTRASVVIAAGWRAVSVANLLNTLVARACEEVNPPVQIDELACGAGPEEAVDARRFP